MLRPGPTRPARARPSSVNVGNEVISILKRERLSTDRANPVLAGPLISTMPLGRKSDDRPSANPHDLQDRHGACRLWHSLLDAGLAVRKPHGIQ